MPIDSGKMEELLYDFRRYFKQLEDQGVVAVPAGGVLPPPGAGRKKPREISFRDRLRKLSAAIIDCNQCRLARTRKTAVPGEGGFKKGVMMIGEGPGADEDRQGRPFVGRSGRLLDKILASVDLSRDDIFITNIVKCRPPGNRDPRDDEVVACWSYLEEQISILCPKAIVTLGSPAAKTLLDTSMGIGRLRGRIHDFQGIPLIPTYHPAYLLRSYTLANRKKVWEDVKLLAELLQDKQ